MAHRGLASEPRGVFLTFEGTEGSGKSLQVQKAREYLESCGVGCVVTREPGGTPFGRSLRRILLQNDGVVREPMGELLLYLADRYQDLHEVILPSLRQRLVVLSDRYHDATRAYQGAARGIPGPVIDRLAEILEIPDPDGTILLDLDPEVGLARAKSRNAALGSAQLEGRFEEENLAFHRAVRQSYLELARGFPERFRVVDASGSPEEVFARVSPLLDEWTRCLRRLD